jgi:FkbM family methyltransferase
MKKLNIYLKYFFEYLKFGDFRSVVASVKYMLNKTSHSEDRIIRTSVGTFFCRKNTNDFQFANFAYEWGVKKYLLDHRNEFSIFIDGGACIGDYCILLSRFGIRCIAYEPVKSNFEAMIKNLELNNLTSKVEAFPYGLGDRESKARFIFNPVNTGASHIADDSEPGDCSGEIHTFDSLFLELNINSKENIFFKLDIEGMETEAIRGAADFIRHYPNITFIIEDKHTGQDSIKEALSNIASFRFGIVDEFNIFARKIK